MHTEEDTFNALKRIPFSELRDIIEKMSDREWDKLVMGKNNKFFERYGWTVREWWECNDY